MRRRAALVVLGLIVMLAAIGLRSLLVVDETEYVLITSFGRPVALYGDQPGETGLHARWPWQTRLSIDRRLQLAEPPAREVMTGDKKNLEVAPFLLWRVVDPEPFVRSAGRLEAAAARLDERASAALADLLSRTPLDAFASTDPAVWRLDRLSDQLRDAIAPASRRELGVEIVELRLRRFGYPLEVRPAMFDLIRSERKQVAAVLRAEGEAEYQTLTSQADRERTVTLAAAEAEAERLRGQAESEAVRVLNEAHAQDPAFYAFLRTLETYRSLLDDRATIVLDAASPLLRLLTSGPPLDLDEVPTSSVPSERTQAQRSRPPAGAAP